jgi:hypothetical protein
MSTLSGACLWGPPHRIEARAQTSKVGQHARPATVCCEPGDSHGTVRVVVGGAPVGGVKSGWW